MKLWLAIVLIILAFIFAILLAIANCYLKLKLFMKRRCHHLAIARPISRENSRRRDFSNVLDTDQRGASGDLRSMATSPPAYTETSVILDQVAPGYKPPPYSEQPPSYNEAMEQMEATTIHI